MFNINSNSYGSSNYSSYTSLYPSIYENITYRSLFDAETLSQYNFTTPFMSSTSAYVAMPSNITRFKMFCPPGAERINIAIFFNGWWPNENCYTGVVAKCWTNGSIKPEKSYSGNMTNFWNGQEYIERLYSTRDNILVLEKSDLSIGKWIYFEIDRRECPASTTEVYHLYKLNLDEYSKWYTYVNNPKNPLWESNGDPPYDEVVIPPNDNKTNISISASSTSVNEGGQLVYTLSLPAGKVAASDFNIGYTMSGIGIDSNDFTNSTVYPAGSIQFKAGSNKALLTLDIKEDSSKNEGNETLSLTFNTSSSDYKIAESTITTTINDTSKADDPVEPDKFVDIAPVEKAFEITSQTIAQDGTIEFLIKDENHNSGTKDSGQFDIAYYLVKSAQQPTINTIYDSNSIPDSDKLLLTNSDGKLTRTISNIVAGASESINDYKLTAVSVPRSFFDLVEDEKIWAVKVIDLDFKILESNNTNDAETNNIDSSDEYQVKLPELHVDKIEAGSQVTAGNDLNVTAHISNSGTAPAQNVIVDFFIVAGDADVNDFIKKKSQYIIGKTGLFAEFPDQEDANLPKVEYTGKSPIVEKLNYETNNNTASVNATIPSSIYSKYNGSFRILAFVNSKFEIPESNSFNNFAKKDFTDAETVTWKDISGASDPVNIVPATPILTLNNTVISINDKDDKSKFLPGNTVTIKYQIDNTGSDFEATPSKEVLRFTTVADKTAPTLFSSDPANNATDVAIDKKIVLTFNEEIKQGKGTIGLHYNDSTGEKKTVPVKEISFVLKTVTITPKENLAYNTDYFVIVDSGAVEDMDGNTFAGLTDKTTLNFKTVADGVPKALTLAPTVSADDTTDTTAPTIKTTTPVKDKTDVPIADDIVLTFGEDITLSNSSKIVLYDSDNKVVSSIVTLNENDKTTVTINPDRDLEYKTTYYVKVTSGAIQDSAGNDFISSYKASVSVYLSEDDKFDTTQDKELNKIPVDNVKEIQLIDMNLPSDKPAGQYYIFVVLHSDGKSLSSKPLKMDILKVFTPTPDVKEWTENFSDAPVYLGDMVTGGSKGILNSELTIKFPAYSEAVDHYAAIKYPDGSLIFIQRNDDPTKRLTKDWSPYYTNKTESFYEKVFESAPVNLVIYPAMKGKWSVYWLTVLSTAADKNLNDILNTEDYELGTYTFDIK